jgi:soluble lytic murein transglycosylase-like protein
VSQSNRRETLAEITSAFGGTFRSLVAAILVNSIAGTMAPLVVASAIFLLGAALDHRRAPRRAGPAWWSEIGPLWPSRSWERNAPAWAAPIVWRTAQVTGVPAALIAAVAHAESRWRPAAISSAGAIGVMQLMPATASGLGVDPYDPAANIMGGARYLRAMLDRFDALDLAVAAYNAGPERVARLGRVPRIEETVRYVAAVRVQLDRAEDAGTF